MIKSPMNTFFAHRTYINYNILYNKLVTSTIRIRDKNSAHKKPNNKCCWVRESDVVAAIFSAIENAYIHHISRNVSINLSLLGGYPVFKK